MENYVEIKEFVGLTFSKIEMSFNDQIIFISDTGIKYKMFHEQSCCENVEVEDINGDLEDLVNSPILIAEEVTSEENPEGVSMGSQESFTWTFYKLATIKGYVTIRWYGESNGYYSEDVSIIKL